MPKYTVTVVAEQTVSQEFEVEAETREEAEDKALAEARDHKFGWDHYGDFFDDHRVASVEVEEEAATEE